MVLRFIDYPTESNDLPLSLCYLLCISFPCHHKSVNDQQVTNALFM